MNRITRRQFIAGLSGLTLGGLLTACGGGEETTPSPTTAAAASASPTTAAAASASPTAATGSPTPATPSSSEAVRVGAVLILTGDFASLGRSLTEGMEFALDEIGGEAGGRHIEIITADSSGNPEQAINKVRELLQREKVHIITGVTLSNEAAAVRDVIVESETPWVISNAALSTLTRDPALRSPYIFRVSYANGQYDAPLAPWAYENLGYRRIVLTTLDYAAGQERLEVFRRHFEEAGGTVVDEVLAPLHTQDYGPYLQRILQADADAVWAWYGSADAVRFVTQYAEFGVRDAFPLFGGGELTDEAYLDQIGDAALDIVTSNNYAPLYDSPENKAFVEQFRERYGHLPGQLEYQGYLAIRVIAEALDATGGAIEDKPAFLEALRNVQFTGPMGEFRFHPETQHVIMKVVIRRVERLEDGSLGNVVIGEVPDVDDLSY